MLLRLLPITMFSSLIGRLAPLVKLQRLINLHTVSYLEQHSTEGDPAESRKLPIVSIAVL